eukprot:CAMPEP_0113630218 /NCGR_PEP_ID=MMETSP0017_2-20120614/15697_1 /TAXON_ID=2856 /ORGANISM="Cylindrotheca closterium" /LENGTH=205 /DNA_ID=CAMNT_0000540667 /DNA_START=129 /DNA_END=746 /DNA_ORIENTATION=+ /assembly_acc=CAM_ASM_000147
MFEKFEEDPYDVDLLGIMTNDEYTAAIQAINNLIKKARPGKVDGVLLATGALMVPLMIWGVRHSKQMKKRKKKLNQGIAEFNAANPTLYMRWNRKPKSILTIERREGQDPAAMAEAQFVGDMVIQAMPPNNQAAPNQVAPNAPQYMTAPQHSKPPPTQAQIPPGHVAPNAPQYTMAPPPAMPPSQAQYPPSHAAAAAASSGHGLV